MRLVLIEDDATIAEPLADGLRRAGFDVEHASDAATGLGLVADADLVLLDLGLPDLDGSEVCRRIREQSTVPIIVISARSDEIDRVLLLESGADDYVVKPFNARELLARVKSVLRRSTRSSPQPKLDRVRMGSGTLDLTRRILIDADGAEQTLAASEFDLLKLFADNPNRPLARDWLLESTSHRDLEAFDRAIDLRILRLRRKIERDPSHPEAIRTVRGIGYMFVPPTD